MTSRKRTSQPEPILTPPPEPKPNKKPSKIKRPLYHYCGGGPPKCNEHGRRCGVCEEFTCLDHGGNDKPVICPKCKAEGKQPRKGRSKKAA